MLSKGRPRQRLAPLPALSAIRLRIKIMSKKPELSKELLEELLDYDPETGTFRWKTRTGIGPSKDKTWKRWNKMFAGEDAGFYFAGKDGQRYSRIKVHGICYPLAKLVWLLSRGSWPSQPIVHLDGNTSNNRPDNLELQGINNVEVEITRRPCKPLPDQKLLLDMLAYNPDTGLLTRKSTGKKLIHTYPDGYSRVGINQVTYSAHRIIFKMVTGRDPEQEIDHINGIRNDNRWCNLREATISENKHNMKLDKRNTAGYRNVRRASRGVDKPYYACVKNKGKQYFSTCFSTPEEASKAATKLRNELHGEYANHG